MEIKMFTITEVKYYEARCCACGDWLSSTTEEDVKQIASLKGWLESDSHTYCSECYSEKVIEANAIKLLDEGMIGEFTRGEITAVACDDSQLWLDIAEEIINQMNDFMDTVRTKQEAQDWR